MPVPACGLRNKVGLAGSCASMTLSSASFFFFSSRRRHTRYIGDWSSDVCSSDLALLNDANSRLLSLVGASLIYSIGVVIGLVLLIVPGLLVAARWSLMAPAIMLEEKLAFSAKDRSDRKSVV